MFSRQLLNANIFGRAITSISTGVARRPAQDSSAEPVTPPESFRPKLWPRPRWLKIAIVAGVIMIAAAYELQTSALQARIFSAYASAVSFSLGAGRSAEIAFPQYGPFDRIRGYTDVPQFVDRLVKAGYQITEQARVSPELLRLMKWGIHPPYSEPSGVGLRIRGRDGRLLYSPDFGLRVFDGFGQIPPMMVQSLLLIENRELHTSQVSTLNPVVEWDRLGWAGLLYAGRKAGLSVPVEGGSTLAVQLEKYRHFPEGRTQSPSDKLRQILGASLRVYRSGPDTHEERQRIVLEYLNTIPLAAQVGYGEVHGIGEGLYAWFGWDLKQTTEMLSSDVPEEQARALKHVLALLCSVRAPSHYLISKRDALDVRINHYTHLMQEAGILEPGIAGLVGEAKLSFLDRAPLRSRPPYTERKHIDTTRTYLQQMLGVPGLYDLDRLHLEVRTPIDGQLQEDIRQLLKKLYDPEFVAHNGLVAERLIGRENPKNVVYSLLLFESTPEGNLLRAHADTLNKPFDLSRGMKMELGSTAKLRTMAHYLQTVASLHAGLVSLPFEELTARRAAARDPITVWAAQTLLTSGALPLEGFLQAALERTYSAGTGETFFTGGGAHTFANFDDKDGGQILTLREAFRRSTNLVFIRLMRDLVRFHEARLPYNAKSVLENPDDPMRRRLLEEAADDESRQILARAYRRLRGLSEDELIAQILGSNAPSTRRLSTLFFAWNPEAGVDDLRVWLAARNQIVSQAEAEKLLKSYDPSRLNLLDYGYLLDRHPLDVWIAGRLRFAPDASWKELLADSEEARRAVSTWLFKTKNRNAQNIRLRIRIERDAFELMTPAWQALGFPFDRLVPSLATSIGSSSDRPIALAELMGIILNDGMRRPTLRLTELRTAAGTPYETALAPVPQHGEQVMSPEVARTLRLLLAEVVENGTAQRLAGAFVHPDGKPVIAGGKTGSGDNRYNTGPMNRTATFAFYIGNKYFGVITAHVDGAAANRYRFTSALPVSVLKMLAPVLNSRLGEG
jgi:membrane peptidoglycan carboxypeptidase